MIEIDALKRQAKLLSRATGEKLKVCLDELARKKGFRDWQIFMLGTVGANYEAKRTAEVKKHRREKWLEEQVK